LNRFRSVNLILVLLGPPGAGKGSIAKLLELRRGMVHLSTGDMIRAELARPDSPVAERIRAVVESGGLVDDATVEEILTARIVGDASSMLLDGYPRNLRQAERLGEILADAGRKLTAAVLFEVPDAVIVQRLSNRRSCPVCGAVYNLLTVPPKVEGVCDRDGERLVARPDDDEETVRRRLELYEKETHPLVEYYRERGRLVRVDGVGEPEKVYRRLAEILAPLEGR
jgi:adenylate kinase